MKTSPLLKRRSQVTRSGTTVPTTSKFINDARKRLHYGSADLAAGKLSFLEAGAVTARTQDQYRLQVTRFMEWVTWEGKDWLPVKELDTVVLQFLSQLALDNFSAAILFTTSWPGSGSSFPALPRLQSPFHAVGGR